ncbi:MAG: type I DNA topoisomerase [Culicoidibacterales bacterium]
MTKNVVIVESPSKSKTIEKYLGKDFTVLSSVGHVRDLATSGKYGLGIDVDDTFSPVYKTMTGKSKVITELKKAVKNADHIYIATDPDREGEAIGWHLEQVLDLEASKTSRIIFREITKQAVLQAIDAPTQLDMNLVHSQETRRMLDRIIGFRLSSLLKKKIQSQSAGRVQSVALKLIVEREGEIQVFVPEEYWKVNSDFQVGKSLLRAELTHVAKKKAEFKTESEVDAALKQGGSEYIVSSLVTKPGKREAKPPFITSTLQQEAANKLGFSARKTMLVAQKLYEGMEVDGEVTGLITYMRTDSTRLSPIFIDDLKSYINTEFGKEYCAKAPKQRKVKSENTQDAHEGIRPTNVHVTPEKAAQYLEKDELKLYSLIWARTVAALMMPAITDNTTVKLESGSLCYTAKGVVQTFDGYLRVYGKYESIKDELLPMMEEGKTYIQKAVNKSQHFTQPPARYSEATLVKALEELGIGRPSTYATILDTLKKRDYVKLEEKRFKPTEQGILTSERLTKHFDSIINVDYTAGMENELDLIAEGNEDYIQYLKQFYAIFEPLVEKATTEMEAIKPKELDEVCPECGKPLLLRKGRYGDFVACSGFPECRYTRKVETEKKAVVSTGIQCPKCQVGEVVERKTRRGTIFYGCNQYPKCDFAIWDKPTGEKCPTCDGLIVTNKKGEIVCSQCDYKKE